ncbi:hypothetical protein EJB05_15125, partial [Eragrostis curvula]
MAKPELSLFVHVLRRSGNAVELEPLRGAKPDAAVTPYATALHATWAWTNPIVSRGRRPALQPSDLPALSPSHRPERVHKRFAARRPASSRQPAAATARTRSGAPSSAASGRRSS